MKMRTEFGEPIKYFLPIGEEVIPMNELINKEVTFRFQNQINCIHCGRKTNKSFSQGFCYPCFTTVPEADPAIVKPELDQAHLGVSRDMEWAKKNSLVDHYVYLAVSSGLKVGVTRHTQVPTRWIDQGASYAIKLAKTPYRNLAGQIEVALKGHFADKTNWRKMLTNMIQESVDLNEEKQKAIELLPNDLKEYISDEDEVVELNYPVENYPVKVTSVGFDKVPEFTGRLAGIKGQYLIFGNGAVINIRKHNGYLVELEY